MKLTENTKVRVKVPKHLYEAIQAELDKKHGMEEGEEMNEYVGMSPDQAQVAEILGSLIAAGGLGVAVKTALQMALDKIKSKKSGGEEKGDINEYVGMSPDQMQVAEILGSLIAAGGLGVAVKTALQMALDKIKSKKSGDAEAPVAEGAREGVYDDFAKWKSSFPEGTEFAQENNYMMAKDDAGKELGKWNPIQKQGMHANDPQYKNLEEVFDLETLMEAVKDLSKKKAEDKKKKEVEAKKKKVEDEKKKKEAEAKKKAATKKKAVNEIFGLGGSKTTFKKGDQVMDKEDQSYWYVKATNVDGDPKLYSLTAQGTRDPKRQDVKRTENSLTKTSK